MKNKINIAELLRNCPKDMELDCTMYEDVYFDYVDTLNIIHCYIQHETHKSSITFNQFGTPNSDIKSKCVIFPKGSITWEGFAPPCKFKDGDVLVHTQNERFVMSIYKSNESEIIINTYAIFWDREEGLSVGMQICCYTDSTRFATEEEKQKLFEAIKENGYYWNQETKTLEELSKFKDGDVVVDDSGAIFLYKQIHLLYNKPYADFYCGLTSKFRSFVIKSGELQRCGEISSLRYATEEEKVKLFQTIEDSGYRWNETVKTLEKLIKPIFKKGDKVRVKKGFPEPRIARIIEDVCDTFYTLVSVGKIDFTDQNNWELVPDKFDISKLKPFDEVLFRMHDKDTWCNGFYGFYKNKRHVVNSVIITKQCIPYKGNEYLLNTTDKCNEFYETWE